MLGESSVTLLVLGYRFADFAFRLWEPGYRERYYEKKFGVSLSDKAFLAE